MGTAHDRMVDEEIEPDIGSRGPKGLLSWVTLKGDGPQGEWTLEVHTPILCTLCEQPNGPFVAGQIHTGAPICAPCFMQYLVCEHRNVTDEGDPESGPQAVCHDCGKSWR
jgi:hypothetical protein